MRNIFEQELQDLNKSMVSMGALCEHSIKTAVGYLLNPVENRQEDIRVMLDQISSKEREIVELSLKLLLKQQPVASDLREVSAALKMVSDLERIGDNADDIAEIISMNNITADSIAHTELKDMSDAACSMLTNSINAFVNHDEQLAKKVISDDDIVDNFFDKIKLELADSFRKNELSVDSLMDLFMVTKYFERIGDHSVNLAQWVCYMVSGKIEGNTN